MEEKIKKIITESVNAPSGDNSQPWKFSVSQDACRVYLIKGADDTLYNFNERGSYLSCGALIENIMVASSVYGLSAEISLLPEDGNDAAVADIKFSATEYGQDELYGSIFKRNTNRKKYSSENLTEVQLQKLFSTSPEASGIHLDVLQDKEKIVELASTLCLNERLLLENYYIHKGLFSYIRWTKASESESKTGLYIKTLELEPPAEKAFKLFRKWNVIKFFSFFGVPKLVARDSAKLYASTPAFGLITASSYDQLTLLKAGRIFQRIWLQATALGLSLQPTAALLYLGQRIEAGDAEKFSGNQINLIREANKKIKMIFEFKNNLPIMMFRIGKADSPSAVSIKKPPQFI